MRTLLQIDAGYRAVYGVAVEVPEASLWRSVILLACIDAHHGPAKHQATARRFLAGTGLLKAMELAMLPVERADTLRQWLPEPPPKRTVKRDRHRYVEHAGQRLTLVQWQGVTGIRQEVIRSRLWRGWTPGQALDFEPKPVRLPGTMRRQIIRDTLQSTQWAARAGRPVESSLRPQDQPG